MKERDLLHALRLFEGWDYSLTKPYYPRRVPGILAPLGPPHQTNCSCFVEGLVIPVAYATDSYFLWTRELHAKLLVYDPKKLLSPVEALEDAGLSEKLSVHGTPKPWTVCQGWRRNMTGHLFIIVRYDPQTDRCLVLEASGRLGGVGWRGIGTIEDIGCTIPAEWQHKTSTTWESLKRNFPTLGATSLVLEDDDSAPTNGSPSSRSQSPSSQEPPSSCSKYQGQQPNGGGKWSWVASYLLSPSFRSAGPLL